MKEVVSFMAENGSGKKIKNGSCKEVYSWQGVVQSHVTAPVFRKTLPENNHSLIQVVAWYLYHPNALLFFSKQRKRKTLSIGAKVGP